MTTSIFTNLIEPFCELFYKSVQSSNVQQQTIDSFRNYNADNTLNFGFELYEPLTDIFSPTIQLGVFTTNNILTYQSNFDCTSNIIMPDVGLNSTVQYVNKTLPIVVNLIINNSVIGVTTAFLTGGYPYDSSDQTDNNIIRLFESYYTLNTTRSILYFVDFVNAYLYNNGNLALNSNSVYKYRVFSMRTTNGLGQFNSLTANQNFSSKATSVDSQAVSSAYEVAYASVYNWKNNLTWPSGFSTWYSINSSLISIFTQKFLHDYFNL
jgi:hypothetical protein